MLRKGAEDKQKILAIKQKEADDALRDITKAMAAVAER